jgi:hypothetical protein
MKNQPGLWVNPAWQKGQPGLLALVIGVSRYQHLQGGPAPVAETYDLKQLQVSALTAFNVFRWLSTEYMLDECPVAQCWLLLAPTAAESRHTPAVAQHMLEPTFAACEHAVGEWYSSLKQLGSSADRSRGLFFFSGHGLEVHQDKQILLPSDYLAPPAGNWDRALSTTNLRAGLASLPVPRQFFFLDACRNDHQKLRSKSVQGTRVLPEDEAAQVNSALVAPLFYATASGHQAWQQPEPARGLSLFGTALLDGLAGKPDMEIRCQHSTYSVNLYPLQAYVKRRVAQQLRDARAEVAQPVKLGGYVDDECLTYLISPPAAPAGGFKSTDITPPASAEAARDMQGGVFQTEQAIQPRRVWARDYGVGHRLFGSESATQTWSQGLGLFGLGKRRRLDPDAVDVHQVGRHFGDGVNTFRVELSINEQDPVGYWLELTDPAGGIHAAVLPVDWSEHGRLAAQPVYLVEFDLEKIPDGSRRLSRLEAQISINNPRFETQLAAQLWQIYCTGELRQAVSTYHGGFLETMVRLKRESSLTATIAGLILLRVRRLDLLHDWLRNLAEWFPLGPDAPVLWAEQFLRGSVGGRAAAESEAIKSLLRIQQRGTPYTAEGLAYAGSMLDRLVAPAAQLGEGKSSPLARLREKIWDVLRYFRPGGLFCCYSGFEAGADPAALLGLPPQPGADRSSPEGSQ